MTNLGNTNVSFVSVVPAAAEKVIRDMVDAANASTNPRDIYAAEQRICDKMEELAKRVPLSDMQEGTSYQYLTLSPMAFKKQGDNWVRGPVLYLIRGYFSRLASKAFPSGVLTTPTANGAFSEKKVTNGMLLIKG